MNTFCKALLIIGFVFVALLGLFVILTYKYRNPYKMIMYIGKKGCGKTTMLTKLAYKHKKNGWYVFCTEKNVANTIYIPYAQIGRYWFPENSVLLVDECGMIWDNRNFANFKPEVRDWFKYLRHNKVKCYLFSQSVDIDKKLVILTDQLFVLQNVFRVFSYGKRINKKLTLNNISTAESNGCLVETMKFDSFLLFPFGSRCLTFIPKWSKGFDSHSRLDIPDMPEVWYKNF